jgi:hypothetical protein
MFCYFRPYEPVPISWRAGCPPKQPKFSAEPPGCDIQRIPSLPIARLEREASYPPFPLDDDRPPQGYFELATPVERPAFSRLQPCWLASIDTPFQALDPWTFVALLAAVHKPGTPPTPELFV